MTDSSSGLSGCLAPFVFIASVVVALFFGISSSVTTPSPLPTPAVGTSTEGAMQSFQVGVDITFPALSYNHINVGDPHPPYNSNPPTSGWHYAQPAACGIYPPERTPPDEAILHSLEHGAVWLSYRDASDTDTRAALEALARQYPSHIILTNRPADDHAVAAAAWQHLMVLDTVDETLLTQFIGDWRENGPEAGIPCPVTNIGK